MKMLSNLFNNWYKRNRNAIQYRRVDADLKQILVPNETILGDRVNTESEIKVNFKNRIPWKLIAYLIGFIIILGGISYQMYDSNKKYDDISSRLTTLTSQLDKVQNEVSNVQSNVSDVQSDVNNISYSTDDVKGTIDDITYLLNDISSQLTSIKIWMN